MAKKNSMPDFTFALGADLREAAAKMREMSRPPKHSAVADAPSHATEEETPSPVSETRETPPPAEPTRADEAAPSERASSEASLSAGPSEAAQAPADQPPVLEPEGPLPAPETAGPAPARTDAEVAPETAAHTSKATSEPATEPKAPQAPGTGTEAARVPVEAAVPPACETAFGTTPPVPSTGVTVSLNRPADQPRSVAEPEELPSSTVINSHEQTQTINDSNTSTARRVFVDSHQTANGSHQQSSAVSVPSVTVDAVQNDVVPASSARERLTDVSASEANAPSGDGVAPTVNDSHYAERHTPAEQAFPAAGTAQGRPQSMPESLSTPAPAEGSGAGFNDRHQPSSTVTYTAQQSVVTPLFPKATRQGGTPQTDELPSIASATLQEAHLGGARQVLLDALTELRQQSPQVVVNLKRLAPAIGLSYGTVRNTISRLVREGVVCTTQVRTGDAHGVCIEFVDDGLLPSLTAIAHPIRQSMTHHQPSLTVTTAPAPPPAMTHDDTSIWSTDADLIAILWPSAADAGFGPAQLAQLRRAYQVQGWEPENVPRCLRYLDWELANGAAGPEHVAAWLRVMQRQGHYPRPEGYVDPEVLRLRQKAEEERERALAR